MNEARRITPQEVQAAYQKCGMKPATKSYMQLNGHLKPVGCCAISALFLAEKGTKEMNRAFYDERSQTPLTSQFAERVNEWAYHKYGVAYVHTFMAGFDAGTEEIFAGSKGYEDGMEVAKCVLGSEEEETT
jgi:hypothetical protein